MNSNQPVEQRIRELLRLRVGRLLMHNEPTLGTFSIGEILNFLFTLEGDTHNIGGFGVSYSTIKALIGEDAIWQKPEVRPEENHPQAEMVH